MNDANASKGHSAPSAFPSDFSGAIGEGLPKLSADQLATLADMIAAGTTRIPESMDESDRELLIREVRTRIRTRLMILVARAVAQEIARRPGAEKGQAHS
jgi:hypothetical protein